MRILIVLIKINGGVGSSNLELAKILKKKGHKVDILSREDNLKKTSLIKSIFSIRKRVKELMKKNNFDVVYTQDYSCALPLIIPYFIFWKEHFCCFCGLKRKGIQKILQFFVGRVMGKKIIVVSDELKSKFKKSTLIYRGVNFKKFKPIGKKRDSLGGLDRSYEGISKKDLKKIAELNKLELKIAGKIPEKKMNIFYNKCKVFISLPKTGGFNNVWAEAMASGVPIIIGNKNGPGKAFPFNKVLENKEKINKINKIIKNPKKINYRKWLKEKGFFWENKTKELLNFFEKNITQ